MRKISRKLVCLICAFTLCASTAVPTWAMSNTQETVKISTVAELLKIKENPSGDYILSNDIVFKESDFDEGGISYNDGHGWDAFDFSGTLNGNGHSIIGLKLKYDYEADGVERTCIGLFSTNVGDIYDLELMSSNIYYNMGGRSAEHYAGGFCAINEGEIKNCKYNGVFSVKAYCGKWDDDHAAFGGSIAGENRGTIMKCETVGEINADNWGAEDGAKLWVGAIAGLNTGELLHNTNQMKCKAGSTDVAFGGICGKNENLIYENLNKGKISGNVAPWTKVYYGGISGANYGRIAKSNNEGDMDIGSGGSTGWSYATTNLGGIAGYSGEKSVISDCKNIKDLIGTDHSGLGGFHIGGIVAYSVNATIENCHNAGQLSNVGKFSSISPLGGNIINCTYLVGCPVDNNATPVGEKYDPNNFNYYIYRSDWLQTESEPFAPSVKLVMDGKSQGAVFAELLQESKVFSGSVVAWDSMKIFFGTLDKGTGIPDYCYERKDIYQAIILNALESAAEKDILDRLETTYGEMIEKTDEIVDKWDTVRGKLLTNKNVYEKLTKNEKEEIGKELLDCLEISDGIMEGFQYTANILESAIKIADSFETLCEHMYVGVMMIEMNDSLKYVVKQMYQECPAEKVYMKDALKSCSEIMDMSVHEYFKSLEINGYTSLGKKGVKLVIQKFWDITKKIVQVNLPWVDIFVKAYEAGTDLSNAMFGTREKVELYHHMSAVADYEELIVKTRKILEDRYKAEKGAVKASYYLSAVDIDFSLKAVSCQDAYDLVDQIDNGIVNQIFTSLENDEYTSLKELFEGGIKRNKEAYEYFQTGWLYNLKTDYPKEYEKYKNEISVTNDGVKKILEVACPVDVYVYDCNNNLIAYVTGEKAWCSNIVSLQLENDRKRIYFYNEESYRVEYIGNDSGKMDITITEHNKTEPETREVYFYDLPLQKGKKYEGNINGKVHQKNEYIITDAENTIESNVDTLLDEDMAAKHTAKIRNGYFTLEQGINQEKTYLMNQKVAIRAILPKGMKFVKWISNAGNIFEDETDVNTTFVMPNKDVEIKAQFITGNDSTGTSGGVSTVSKKTITSENGVGGTISPSEKVELFKGASQTFTITPDVGYEIADVLVDGKSVGAVSSYTFENVTSDHTISATFKKKEEDKNPEADALAKRIKAAKAVKIKASSSQGVNKKGKRYIKIKWTKKGAAVTGYQVYRSFKKKSGFKKFYTTKEKYYYNTKALKKGKRHYYKVRAYTVIDGKKYYSKWSNLAYRTVKK